jgi:hypothetical protein
VHRNEKRKPTTETAPGQETAKGYGKVRVKDDIDWMVLELRLRVHTMIAKQMVTHFPWDKMKQIRDTKKEVAYKKLLQSHLDDIEASSGCTNETTHRDI